MRVGRIGASHVGMGGWVYGSGSELGVGCAMSRALVVGWLVD